jgi:hypothetical protein
MKPLHSNDRFVRVPSLMTLASKDGKQPQAGMRQAWAWR